MPLKSKLQKVLRYFGNPDLYRYGFRSATRLSGLKGEPIIVCGAPRSGTTLLISILDSHPDILAIPYETGLFVNKTTSRWFKSDALNHKLIFVFLKAFLISLNVSKDHKRWCEKTPENVLHLDFIFRLFNRRVKVIHIIRDGRDVVMSHHKQLGKFMTPQKWVRYVEKGLSHKNDPLVLTIRYEEIITDFDKTLQVVSDFLDIKNTFRKEFYLETKVNNNASVISGYGYKGIYEAKPISSASLYKWKNNPEVIQDFRNYGPGVELLEKLGYEKSPGA